MKDLTIVYITNRDEPKLEWFFESLNGNPKIVVVDSRWDKRSNLKWDADCGAYLPKPTVWSGPSRLTKEDWWSASNARNTGISLCRTKWIAFADDRSVVLPGWLDRIQASMTSPMPYVVCGAYQKVTQMVVENGSIKSFVANPGRDSRLNALDPRLEYAAKYWVPNKSPYKCPGEWTYGCSLAMPLEWALSVGGFDETCDGSGGEDYIFGLMLQNNGYPIYFDPEMKIVEDRTPSESQPTMIRRDFGISPNDYSHKILNLLKDRKTAMHGFDIRKLREDALNGKPWPKPWGPTNHLWDGKPLSELK